eukprot:765446-Hanusia_phi.AAC.2
MEQETSCHLEAEYPDDAEDTEIDHCGDPFHGRIEEPLQHRDVPVQAEDANALYADEEIHVGCEPDDPQQRQQSFREELDECRVTFEPPPTHHQDLQEDVKAVERLRKRIDQHECQ